MIYSSKNGQIEVIKELIKNNADVNMQNNNGDTTLMIASKNGQIELVKELIKNNADFNIQDKNGNTALIYSSEKRKNNVSRRIT